MRRYSLMSLTILISGLTLSAVTSYTIHRHQNEKKHLEFLAAAQSQSHLIQRSLDASIAVGKAITSFYNASVEVTREEFALFVNQYLQGQTSIQAIEWAPKVSKVERPRYEFLGRQIFDRFFISERDQHGDLSPAEPREEYFPVYFIEPYKGNEKAVGYDIASEPLRCQALYYARDNNSAVITQRVHLVQNNSGQWGFLSMFPVYRNGVPLDTVERRRSYFMGLVVIVFNIEPMLDQSLHLLHPAGLDVTITDESAPDEEKFLYHHKFHLDDVPYDELEEDITQTEEHSYYESISVADRRWMLRAVPAHGFYSFQPNIEVWTVLLVGVVITLLVTAYVRLIQKRHMDLSAHREELEREVEQRTYDLQQSNKELESYSYSIAHDLRSPLRTIAGFSQILQEDARERLNAEERNYLDRVIAASKYMAELIDSILELSRITRTPLTRESVDLSAIAHNIAERLQASAAKRDILWQIQPGLKALGDSHLCTVLLENLLGNAFKFTSTKSRAEIEFGIIQEDNADTFFVRDNGVGFDMRFYDKLFLIFQRLHQKERFDGTGVGLATVERIVHRHGGKVWAKGAVDEGATFYFTLP